MLSMFHTESSAKGASSDGFNFNIRSPNISAQAAQQGLVCFKISIDRSEAQIDHIVI